VDGADVGLLVGFYSYKTRSLENGLREGSMAGKDRVKSYSSRFTCWSQCGRRYRRLTYKRNDQLDEHDTESVTFQENRNVLTTDGEKVDFFFGFCTDRSNVNS
jgi:hypothetical protein